MATGPEDEIVAFANGLISDGERRHRIALTVSARELLVNPIIEAAEKPEGLNRVQTSASVARIMAALAEGRPDARGFVSGSRDSQAVIRAFATHFCNIPPFCDQRGR